MYNNHRVDFSYSPLTNSYYLSKALPLLKETGIEKGVIFPKREEQTTFLLQSTNKKSKTTLTCVHAQTQFHFSNTIKNYFLQIVNFHSQSPAIT